ncbi:hypothetical protein [Amycolatopsis sp. NPDC054798]
MGRVVLTDDDDELTTVAVNERILPLGDMQPNPENPRPTTQQTDETAASLVEHGQLHNVNVMSLTVFISRKPHLVDKLTDQPFVVLNGNLRLAGAAQLGLPGLRYELHDEWTENQIDEAVIAENEHRKAMNPLLLGRHLKRMLPRYNNSERELARALKKAPAWVNHRIALTRLAEPLQDAIEADRIGWTIARECPRLHPELQERLAAGELAEDVARQWLVVDRLSKADQLERWTAMTAVGTGVNTPYSPHHENESAPAGADAAEQTPVARPKTPAKTGTAKRAQPGLVIRVPERTPEAVATALRGHLTEDELNSVVELLM